ncbi:hypothetical protein [Bacillus cihuensis]|uniref:hypothetical protein n=1 Tax=Bacillus cihuensis TaxID=1208599 RepID=UPI0012693588|nr:hypothetical protein [Bacillus cihuensis]
MNTLIIMTCVVVFTIIMILKMVDKKSEYIKWGLGVECGCFYSSRFTVNKQGITLIGYQKVLGVDSPIQYSVVEQNWWGKTKVYGQVVVYGDYKSPNCFNIAFTNIPYGEEYRIEVLSNCNISRGKIKIMTE